eukprot:328975-Pleurochrysis_carterae.AAC.4
MRLTTDWSFRFKLLSASEAPTVIFWQISHDSSCAVLFNLRSFLTKSSALCAGARGGVLGVRDAGGG